MYESLGLIPRKEEEKKESQKKNHTLNLTARGRLVSLAQGVSVMSRRESRTVRGES